MFAKIFSQIFDSSIVENPEVRFTFMDLLVLADINGVVDMTQEAIARRTNRPIETIRQTITELESPDTRSRTPDYDGRRLKRLDDHRDWGWMIVNYDHFRKTASEEQRREKTLSRVQKHRQKQSKYPPVTPCNAPVTHTNASNAMQKKRQKQMENTPLPPKGGEKGPLQLRAEALMKRRPETPLTPAEQRAFKKSRDCIKATTEEDWKTLEAYYAAPQRDTYSRKDLATLVNNWNGEIDRAKAWKINPQIYGTSTNQNGSRPRSRFADRNKGTLNEGQSSKYAEFMEAQNAAAQA